MTDDMQPRARAALDGLRVDVIPSDRRIAALETQLLSVCQREAETYCRHDARIEALEAALEKAQNRVAFLEGMVVSGQGEQIKLAADLLQAKIERQEERDRADKAEAELSGGSFYQEKDIDAFMDRIEALETEIADLRKKLAESEACAARYKSERDGLNRKVTDVQRQYPAATEAELRIFHQREEINRLLAEIADLRARMEAPHADL